MPPHPDVPLDKARVLRAGVGVLAFVVHLTVGRQSAGVELPEPPAS
jgi:hypothetical protein